MQRTFLRFLMAGASVLSMTLSGTAQQNPMPTSNPPVLVRFKQDGVAGTTRGGDKAEGIANTRYDHGSPSPEEQLMLEMINRARANPTEEGIRLANTTDQAVRSAYQFFSINIPKIRTDFASYPSRPPLAFHRLLNQASRVHSEDMRTNDFQEHTSPTTSKDPFQRMRDAGYIGYSVAGENIFAYSQSVWHAHCGLNVDWGADNQITLGHRKNIMNYEQGAGIYTEIGISILPDNNPSTRVGPLVVTQKFGRRTDIYVTGVVYNDKNGNGFYDIGEGLPNVEIRPSRGSFFAVSSSSGGYAIPVTGLTGSISLTATGEGLGGVQSKTVQLTGQNVKVDFTSTLPGSVALHLPENGATLDTLATRFAWYRTNGATNYELVVSEKDDLSTPLLKQELSDTTLSYSRLANGKMYYWAVRAQTNSGWGDLSSVFEFSTYILPTRVTGLSPANGDTVVVDSVILRWANPGRGVNKYWLELADNDVFFPRLINDSSITDTFRLFTNLKPNQEYFWQISARNSLDWGDYSEIRSFFTIGKPVALQLLAPGSGLRTSADTVRLRWSNNGAIVKRAMIQVASDSLFTQIIIADSSLTDTTFTLRSLRAGERSYWRVAGWNQAGWGEFTAPRWFFKEPLSVSELRDLSGSGVWPNPVGDVLTVELPTFGSGVEVSIISATGEVRVLPFRSTSGSVSQVDVRHLEAGRYFLLVKVGDRYYSHGFAKE